MAEKILFITGKLAERQLKRILRSMKPDFGFKINQIGVNVCLLYTSPSPRDLSTSRMPSSA